MKTIDVLIVTALPVEKEAVLKQLKKYKKVQKDHLAFTSYEAEIKVSPLITYTIALVSLLEMGNVSAGVRTTNAINEYAPKLILMVGIAGGLRSEVELGDVIIANQIYYYELSKIKNGGNGDNRPRVFQIGAQVLDRASNFDNKQWMKKIGVPRPSGKASVSHPVRFGPIAVGEKVRVDEEFEALAKTWHSKMLGVDMESYGVAAAVAEDTRNPAYLSIRGICDYADPTKNDEWHEYAASSAAAFAISFLKSGPIPQKLGSSIDSTATETSKLLVVHQSMQKLSIDAIKKSVKEETVNAKIETILIDQSDLYIDGHLTKPEEAIRRQVKLFNEIRAKSASFGPTDIHFGGIAHIPLLFLAGFQWAFKGAVSLLEHRRVDDSWDQLKQEDNGVQLLLENAVPTSTSNGDVILRIEISFPIVEALTTNICPHPIASLNLKVPTPARDIVTNPSAVKRLTSTFLKTLDEITSKLPNTNTIHLFYSGPVCLAFNFGRFISNTTHPRVVVYNFNAQPVAKYTWGVAINASTKDENFLVKT